MPNYAYHWARAEGGFVRRMYRALLSKIVARKITPRDSVPFEVFAYSGHDTLPEQVASIRSFLRHAGRPTRFTIVSDGTHTKEDVELLQQIDPSVVMEELPSIPAQLPVAFASYLQSHPTGKQLALIMSLPRTEPALYVDSDIYFFPHARDLATLARTTAVPAFYLLDCQFSGDARLIRSPNERERPVNTGALFLFQRLDWSLGLERFAQLNGAPNFFTNQTITHLVMHANSASPLDPAKFVLQLDDQTIHRDLYAGDRLALRHYVNPVRHKFWTTLWRQ